MAHVYRLYATRTRVALDILHAPNLHKYHVFELHMSRIYSLHISHRYQERKRVRERALDDSEDGVYGTRHIPYIIVMHIMMSDES